MRLRIHLAPVLLGACLAAACAQTEAAARPGEAEARIAELTAERDAAREEVERLDALVARLTALCPPPGFSAPHGPLAAEWEFLKSNPRVGDKATTRF